MTTETIIAWTEIPVADLDKAIAFYNAVFDWQMTIDTSGPGPVAVLGGSMANGSGHLCRGKPAEGGGPILHITLRDRLEDAVIRCRKAGGTLTSDIIPIPEGRFVYATDLDGNCIGLFERARAA
jgi:predicted enzyme related to lactoylglutathione lyase